MPFTTPNMNLTLPYVNSASDPGPNYAVEINNAFVSGVDGHNHTTGQGEQVPTAGLNINADLTFNGYSLNNVTNVNGTTGVFSFLSGTTLVGSLSSSAGSGLTVSAPTGSFPVLVAYSLTTGGGTTVVNGPTTINGSTIVNASLTASSTAASVTSSAGIGITVSAPTGSFPVLDGNQVNVGGGGFNVANGTSQVQLGPNSNLTLSGNLYVSGSAFVTGNLNVLNTMTAGSVVGGAGGVSATNISAGNSLAAGTNVIVNSSFAMQGAGTNQYSLYTINGQDLLVTAGGDGVSTAGVARMHLSAALGVAVSSSLDLSPQPSNVAVVHKLGANEISGSASSIVSAATVIGTAGDFSTATVTTLNATTLLSSVSSSVSVGNTFSQPTGSFPILNANTVNLGGGGLNLPSGSAMTQGGTTARAFLCYGPTLQMQVKNKYWQVAFANVPIVGVGGGSTLAAGANIAIGAITISSSFSQGPGAPLVPKASWVPASASLTQPPALIFNLVTTGAPVWDLYVINTAATTTNVAGLTGTFYIEAWDP